MFTSLPPRRLRWSAGAAGRSSPNRVPAPYSGNVTSRTRQNRSQSDTPGPKTDLRTDNLRPERPDANGPGPQGPAPPGKSGVHRITRCPSLLRALRRSVW